MAEAFGFGLDLSGLNTAIDNADKKMKQLATTSKNTAKAIDEAFKQASMGGIKQLSDSLEAINNALKGKGAEETVKKIGTQAVDSANKIMQLVESIKSGGDRYADLMARISGRGEYTGRKSGALASLEEQISATNKQLAETQARLDKIKETFNFYLKGEGLAALDSGVVDTNALQAEADALMKEISLLKAKGDQLERNRESLIAQSKLRLEIANRQETRDNNWGEMEAERKVMKQEEARIANEIAKAHIQSYDERYIAYEGLFDEIIAKEDALAKAASDRAKANSEAWKNSYEETQRFYEQWINSTHADEQASEEESQRKRQEEIEEQNKQAKERGEQAKKSYEEQTRAYERMFDEIEAKEKQKAEAEKKRRDKEIEDARKAAEKKAEAERKEQEKLQKEKARLQAEYDSKSRRERYKGYITSYEGAIRTSDRANNLLQEQQAIKNLEAARAKLSKTDADYEKKLKTLNDRIKQHEQNIAKAKGKVDDLGKSHKGLMDISGQLARKLALVFSVSQITGYIKKLVEVRGEFELQQKALQAIVQNVDEANKLWQKTVDLAVKSPFRVKELVTYTKQLAAYRVETDKLYDTTKMLADVSAGLGVDMQRLILAYGQVKAANYLRGTELRQFSEAGINILGELAKYFTELEGRAVSVGDVFERVSKRMVAFTDVEEIFKRITSEGGTFYNMQELQAETLKGQMSNLRDSIDIMMNEIGTSQDGVLKTAIKLTRSLIENWRIIQATAVPILSAMITRWGLFKVAAIGSNKTIIDFAKTFGKHFGLVITQLTRGTRVAKQFSKSTGVGFMSGWSTVILSVIAALSILIRVMQNANRVKKELEKIDISGAFDASRSVAEYKRLADIVSDTSKSYDEQQKALTTLKNKYEDILPSHLLESDTIKALKGNYEEATKAIYEYVAAKTKEKQIETIQSEYGEDVEEQASDLADDIKKALAKVAPNIRKSDVLPIVNKLQEMIQLGDVNILNVDEAIKNLVRQFTGLEISSDAWKYTFSAANGEMVTLENNAESLVLAMRKMKTAMDDITSSSLSWQDSFIYQDFNRVKDQYEEQSDAIGRYYETIRQYKTQSEQNPTGVSDELKRDYEAAISYLNSIFSEAGEKAPDWSAIINEPFKLNKATIDANKLLWGKMIDDINAMPIMPSQAGAKTNYVELLEDEMDSFAGSEKQQEVARVAQGLADTMKVSLEGLDELFLKSDESMSEYAKRVSETLNTYKENLLQFDTDVKNGTKFGVYTKEQAELARTQIPFLTEYLKLFEAFLSPKGKADTPEDTFTPQLRAVREIYDEYKRLSDMFDDVQAKEGAMAKFGDAFKTAFNKTPEEMGFDLFSQEGIEKAYDYLISQAPDAKKKIQAELAKGEVVWDLKIQRRKEEDERLFKQIEDMFDNYDLTLELRKLHIPSDIFGINEVELSDIRKKVEDELAKAETAGGQNDRVARLKETLEKINDMEDKAQIERLKTYLKYTRDAIGERAKIKLEELTKLKEIEETFRKAEEEAETEDDKKRVREQKASAISGVQRETNEALSKMDWEEFRKSETFISLFDDLEGASDAILKKVIEDLDNFKKEWKDLPIDQMKEVIELRNKAQRALESEDSPWGEAKRLRKLIDTDGRSREQAELDSYNAEQEKTRLEDELEMIGLINLKRAEGTSNDELRIVLGEKYSHLLGENVDLVKREGDLTNKLIPDQEAIIDNAQDRVQNEKDLIEEYKKQEETLREIQNMANDLYDSFKELSEALGADGDSPAAIFADMGMSMANSVLNAIMLSAQLKTIETGAMAAGTALNTAMGVIGWIVMGVQLLTQVITAIAKMKDNQIVAQLEDQAAIIERQRDLYEQIEEKVDKAYSVDQLRQYNDEMKRSVELEIQALEASIALEKSRKKADEDQIADWQKEIDEARKRLEESTQEMKEMVGGIFDLEDFTSGFVDAWWDAMEEGMDGLDALNDHFEDTMKDLVKKQALYKGAQKIMEQVMNAINADLEGDYDIDDWAEIERIAKKANIDLDAFLQGYKDILGSISNGEAGGLSALEKGVQGMTTEQAEILSAYWNASRQSLSNIDSKMDIILANMGLSSSDENPMLSQLRLIATQTTAINNLLSSVTAQSNGRGGTGIKVYFADGTL